MLRQANSAPETLVIVRLRLYSHQGDTQLIVLSVRRPTFSIPERARVTTFPALPRTEDSRFLALDFESESTKGSLDGGKIACAGCTSSYGDVVRSKA